MILVKIFNNIDTFIVKRNCTDLQTPTNGCCKVSGHCDEEYVATTEPGLITSPGYPDSYPNNVDSCVTLIYTNESKVIQLSFDEFDVEQHSECNYDYLEVCSTMTKLHSCCHNPVSL